MLLYERAALLEVRLSPDGDDRPHDLLLMPLRTIGHVSDRVLGALIPRFRSPPPRLVPVKTLSLENWAFVEADGAIPRLRHEEPLAQSPVTLLQRLVANSRFVQARR
ncbi:hypothetical protein N7E02_25555 [Aliirhizobium terrae]|uniref:hypothetical protein n=1 Tax=Terrirhizobium terrae TaxID=2926709 RepID=UPI0025768CA0|nr:hypothetical protein [Rhizobium sp. CC-CFT758]WJH39994.1 hypothetical protein N7E02_25555 [Rhizobium sp. CC-CFT758]